MIYATVALAAVATAIAAQTPPPLASGNDSGLGKTGRALSVQELKLQQRAPSEKPSGRVTEVAPPGRGLQPGPCGMPIIAADPSVDPQFVITTPESERREAKIRTVESPKCGPVTLVPAKKPQEKR